MRLLVPDKSGVEVQPYRGLDSFPLFAQNGEPTLESFKEFSFAFGTEKPGGRLR